MLCKGMDRSRLSGDGIFPITNNIFLNICWQNVQSSGPTHVQDTVHGKHVIDPKMETATCSFVYVV